VTRAVFAPARAAAQAASTPHARRRSRSHRTVMFHVKHPYFPIQKDEKISPNTASTSIRPVNESSDPMAVRISSAASSGVSRFSTHKIRAAPKPSQAVSSPPDAANASLFQHPANRSARTSESVAEAHRPPHPSGRIRPGHAYHPACPNTKCRHQTEGRRIRPPPIESTPAGPPARALTCPLHSDLFDNVLGLPKTGRVQQRDGDPIKVEPNFDHVTRRPGRLDVMATSRPAIALRRWISQHWRTEDRHLESVPHPFSDLASIDLDFRFR
jgi:hypothetical protein